MFDWIRGLFVAETPRDTSLSGQESCAISDLLVSPGKANTEALIALVNQASAQHFASIFPCATLVGSSIREGKIGPHPGLTTKVGAFETFTFTSADIETIISGQSIEQSIFVLHNELTAISNRTSARFTIGRARSSDVRIVDFAISRSHAAIEVTNGRFYIADCHSRNGTKVNGKRVFNKPTSLVDGDIVSLGRYEFTFLLPASLYYRLRHSQS
jgi:hypothetical protein